MMPHWEHGHRCHGYWLGTHERVAYIGLTPPGFPIRYFWSVGLTGPRGEAPTLRQAKHQVEHAWRQTTTTHTK